MSVYSPNCSYLLNKTKSTGLRHNKLRTVISKRKLKRNSVLVKVKFMKEDLLQTIRMLAKSKSVNTHKNE